MIKSKNCKYSDTELFVFFAVLPIVIILAFQIGFRDQSIGTDFHRYVNFYLEVAQRQHPKRPGEYGFIESVAQSPDKALQ